MQLFCVRGQTFGGTHHAHAVLDSRYREFGRYAAYLLHSDASPLNESAGVCRTKKVSPHVESNMLTFRRSEMRKEWLETCAEGLAVKRELFSVDAVCLISWLVYDGSWYTHFVPTIESLSRLSVPAGSREDRDVILTGSRGREQAEPAVPATSHAWLPSANSYEAALREGILGPVMSPVLTYSSIRLASLPGGSLKHTYRGCCSDTVVLEVSLKRWCTWLLCRRRKDATGGGRFVLC